jgi:hypothetical protein
MSRGLGLALLVIGVILLIFGINASNSVSSDLSNLFTGKPTDKAVWLIVGGAAALVIGLFGTLAWRRGSRT